MSIPQSAKSVVAAAATNNTSSSPSPSDKQQQPPQTPFDSGYLGTTQSSSSLSLTQSCELIDSSSCKPTTATDAATALLPPTAATAAVASASGALDSGLCDEDSGSSSSSSSAAEMLVDKQSSAHEWSCSGAQTDVRNNLDKAPAKSSAARFGTDNPMVLKEYMSLWKVCYIQNEFGDTQLHAAILNKMSQAIVNIIRLAPQNMLLDLRNDEGQCGMHYAVLTRQPLVIRQLRAAGAQPFIRDYHGNTPLHLACLNNDLSCVEALTSPLTGAEQQQFPYAERIPLLPADTACTNYDGETCLHLAAYRGNVAILRQLVATGADLNVREHRGGYTVLHIACEQRDQTLLAFLLGDECRDRLQLEQCNYGRRTAYQLAQMVANGTAMEQLRASGARPLEPMSDDEEEDDDDSDDDDDDDDQLEVEEEEEYADEGLASAAAAKATRGGAEGTDSGVALPAGH